MSEKVGTIRRGIVLCTVAVLACACSSQSDAGTAEAKSDAQKLTNAAHGAGVAPGLTPQRAESLYGTSAPQICDVLEGGVSTVEANLLKGSSVGRRGKLITTDAITYERLVVQTYCPAEMSTFDDLVADIDPTESTR